MIVLVETESAVLELCRIVEEPDRRTPSLCTIVRLGLPPLAPGAFIRNSYCGREIVPAYSDAPSLAIEGRPPRRLPFHSSPEEGLVTIVITIQVDDVVSWFTFVTLLRTLVALATTTPPGVTFISWENWGPRATACFILPFVFHSEPQALMGERCTTISRGRLFLFDFNSTRIRDAIRRTGNSSGCQVYVSTVEHRSMIHRGRFFRKDVVSELPFISVNVPAPLGWKRVVNYEEGLAGFSSNVRWQLFSPLISFWALIIAKDTRQNVLCPGVCNRMNFYHVGSWIHVGIGLSSGRMGGVRCGVVGCDGPCVPITPPSAAVSGGPQVKSVAAYIPNIIPEA